MTQVAPQIEIRRDNMGLWHDNLLVTPLVTEEMLAAAFIRFKADNLLDRIWQEGPPTLSWFLKQYSKENGVQVLGCLKKDEHGELSLCGLSWVCSRQVVANVLTKCEVGEGFYRGTKPTDTYWFGVMSLDYIFDELGVDVVFGTTAEKNRAAVRYAKSLGMEMFGPIPRYTTWKNKETEGYEPCSIWVSCMTKERWEARNER